MNKDKAGELSTQQLAGEFCRVSKGGEEYKVIYFQSKRYVIARFKQLSEAVEFACTSLGADKQDVLFNSYI